jgi:hypothetical protein
VDIGVAVGIFVLQGIEGVEILVIGSRREMGNSVLRLLDPLFELHEFLFPRGSAQFRMAFFRIG